MKDGEKTKEQLINELVEMRHRIAELEAADTERQRAEERAERLNGVLRAIRQVNQLIVRERDRSRLLQAVCNSLIETRSYHNAWIALLDESGGLVTTAEAGLGEEFLPLLKQLKRGELTACGQRALARRGVVVTDDPLSACADCPLSAKCADGGAMTVRLEPGGKVYGLLSASISAHFSAGGEERFLFEEVAGDIAFALHSIELEEGRKQAEEALKESRDAYQATFESTGTAMLIGEEDSTISMINTQFEKLCGYSKEEVEGKKNWVEFIVKADLERLKESHHLRMIDPNAAPPFYEFQFIDKQGSVKYIFITLALIPGTKKTVGSLLDITEHKRAEEALRDSRRMLQTVLDSIPSAVFWKDRDSIYLGGNLIWLEAIGLRSSEEVVGKSDYDLPWGKKLADSFREDDRKVMESGIPEYDIVEPYLRADGTHAWANTNKVPLLDMEGNVVGVLGTYEDITERKRAEEEIRQKTEDLALINALNDAVNRGDSLPGIIQLLGRETMKVFSCNGATVYLLSEDGEHLVMQNLNLPPAMVNRVEKLIGMKIPALSIPLKAGSLYREVLQTGKSQLINDPRTIQRLTAECVETHHLPRQLRPAVRKLVPQICRLLGIQSVIIVPLISEGGAIGLLDISRREPFTESDRERLEALSGELMAVIKRKQAEEELRRLKEFNESIIQKMAEGIVVQDAGGTFAFVNPAAADMLGYAPEELLGRRWATIVPLDQQPIVQAADERRVRGEADRYELELMHKDGQRIPVLVSASPGFEEDRLAGTLAVFTNITERKRAERLLQALNRAALAMEQAFTLEEVFAAISEEFKKLGFSCAIFPVDESRSRLFPKYLSHEARALKAAEKLVGLEREGFSIPIEEVGTYRKVVREKKTVFVEDVEELVRELLPEPLKRFARQIVRIIKIPKALDAPLIVGDEVIGVLAVQSDDLTAGDMPAITAFAHQMGASWRKAQLVEDLERSLAEVEQGREELQRTTEVLRRTLGATIQAMAMTVETRDPYTAGHQRRVADLARAIATEMGLPKEQVEGIRMAATIHDIGKITVPTDILNKPAKLSEHEFGIVRGHPKVGHDVLKTIEFPWPIAQMIFQHHERMNGSGYPQGLSGEEIILEARILAVADVVEAMASHRPYRPARGIDEALEEISQNRGILYDPEVVDVCLKLFTEKGFKLG